MKLHNLMDEALILWDHQVPHKQAALDILLEHLHKHYPFNLGLDVLKTRIEERESLGDTTLPHGLAIPHARLVDFSDIVIGILKPKEPFIDKGICVRLVVMIFSSAKKPSLYLNTLSALNTIARDETRFTELLQSPDAYSFLKHISSYALVVRRPVLIADVMGPIRQTKQIHTPVQQIVDLFHRERLSYLPIVDPEGRLKGEIRLMDLIETGVPDYAMNMILDFAMSLEPFETLLAGESHLVAMDLMKPPAHILSPDQPLLEAARLFIQSGLHQLPVVAHGRLVGVLSQTDILQKILRA